MLENILTFQYIYTFFCFFMMIMVWSMYHKMNKKAKDVGPTHVIDEDKKDDVPIVQAINN